MDFIKKLKIDDTIYVAKTDFKTALRCIEIDNDETIGNYERALGVLCTLFGANAIDNPNHYEKLLKWAKNYLSCGVEVKDTHKEPDMDFKEDYSLIYASFLSDYKINLDETNMTWERFYALINGLSNSDFGNCCILNRVRNIRNTNLSEIKDEKERQKMAEAKKELALKKYKKQANEKQKQSAINFYKQLGLIKEEG